MKPLNINEFLKTNSFEQLIQATQQQIRQQPLELDLRFQLFAIYCLQQDWNKASKQIEFCSSKSKDYLAAHALYSSLILGEHQRQRVFFNPTEKLTENLCLQFLSQTELKPLLANQANLNLSDEVADDIRESYFTEFIQLPGNTNLGSFEWITDSDTRLGANIEVFGKNGFRVIGLSNIQKIEILKPNKIMDLIWSPIRIYTNNSDIKNDLNSDSNYLYMPSRYPFSPIENVEQLSKEKTKCLISSMTCWTNVGRNGTHGFGLKNWLSNSCELPLFELLNLQINM